MVNLKSWDWETSEKNFAFGDWQGNATIHGNEAMGTSQQLLPEVLTLIRG